MPPPRGPRAAPLQLELGAADRLAALIEASGEPLAPERAAGALLALPHVPGSSRGACWRRSSRTMRGSSGTTTAAWVSSGSRHPRARRSQRPSGRSSTSRRRASARAPASSRSVRCGSSAASRQARSHASSTRASRCPRASRRSRASATATSPARARCGPRWPSCSRLRVAACSSPTTRPSTSACSIAPSRASTARASGCACSTRSASHGGSWPAGWRGSTSPASRERFDVTVRPCHRALPDALATAEVLLRLIALAQERGAESAEDVMMLALAAPRRARQRRYLAAGMPAGPGCLRHARPARAGALRRQGRRPAHPRALVLRVAPPAAAHRGRARGARRDRRGAHRIRARGRGRRARSDPPLAAAGQCPRRAARPGGLPAAGAGRARAGARPAHRRARRRRGLRRPLPVSPDGHGGGRGAARRLPAAHVQAARARGRRPVPARRGRSLPRALPRGRRRTRVSPLGARHLRPGWPASRAWSTRRCEPASRARSSSSASRTQGARRALLDAVRAADAQVSTIRRARRRTGVLLAADLDPRHVVAFAVVRGALVAKRRLPRQGDPGLELGAVAAAIERALDPAAALEPRAEGPWLPAERYSEALLLARAFAGRAPGVVPVACTAPDALGAPARRGGSPPRAAARAAAARPPPARRRARGGCLNPRR